MLIAALIGFAIPMATLLEVSSIRMDSERAVVAGSNTLTVTGHNRTPLPAAQCESLNSVPGVLAAGGVISRTTVFALARPGDLVTLITGTPSLGAVFWPSNAIGTTASPASVIAGDAAARKFGLGRGSEFAFTRRFDPTPLSASVDRVGAPSTREAQLDASVFIASAPVGTVDQCLVEATPGARAEVVDVVDGWFAANSQVVVSPLYLSTSKSATPEDRLKKRTTQYIPLAGAGVLAIGLVAAWVSRRAEVSLYRMLGVEHRKGVTMFATEVLAVVLAPLNVGMVTAMVMMRQHEPVEVILATGDALRTVTLLLGIPVLGWAIMLPLTRIDALSGR